VSDTAAPCRRFENWDDPAWIDYLSFTRETANELSGRMRDFSTKAPEVGLVLFMDAGVGDVVMHEVNNAITARAILGPKYRREDQAVAGRISWHAVTINNVLFLDIPYRFTAISRPMRDCVWRKRWRMG